jgi:phosphoglycolate phosphatase
MRYTYAFFDLDGTLIDSSPGITHSVQYAAQKMGITPPPSEELLGFIGPPLLDSFCKYFGMSPEDGRRAVDLYRENYRAGGMLECRVYEGIGALLDCLCQNGITPVLATCKPTCFATQILEHHGLIDRFAFVSGPELDGTRGEKHEVIAHAIDRLAIADKHEILMIGDRDNDMLGAAHHGIDSAGVLWGFGSREELVGAGAVHLCESVDALGALLLAD